MKALPVDQTAERHLLGLAMTYPTVRADALDQIVPADLHAQPLHQTAWQTITQLHHHEQPCTPTQIAAEAGLDDHDRRQLLAMAAEAPPSTHARWTVERVARLAACWRACDLAWQIDDHAREGQLEDVAVLARDAEKVIAAPDIQAADIGRDVLELVSDESGPEYDWLIPGFLERTDRMMISGGEGSGKSTWVRQILVQAAVGVHPFTGLPGEFRVRGLHVDLENSWVQSRREYARLADHAGARLEGGMVAVKCRPQGLDLCSPRDQVWLDGLVGFHAPELVAVGPLYKMYRGSAHLSKSGEEAAELVTSVVDRLRARHGVAVLIEAHTTHDAADFRPRGSRLWEGWPEFGVGLRATADPSSFDVVHWRGQRDASRRFPSRLDRSAGWPWVAGGLV